MLGYLCICSTRFFATSHLKLRNSTGLFLLWHSLKTYFAHFPLIHSSLLKCRWMKAAKAAHLKDSHWKHSVTLQRVAWYIISNSLLFTQLGILSSSKLYECTQKILIIGLWNINISLSFETQIKLWESIEKMYFNYYFLYKGHRY